MSRRFCSFLLFRLMGWKVDVTVPMGDKYIIALAPHTSNFDFLLGVLYSRAMNFRCDFLMKSEWFFWPLGILMRWLGGIPVYRSKKMSMTDQLGTSGSETGYISPLHHSGRHSFTYGRMEKRVLLYRLEGRAAYFIVWN